MGGIVWSPNTFCILFAIITGLAVNEFDNIVEEHGLAQPNKMINMVSAVYLFLAVFLYINRNFSCVIFMPYLFSLLYIMIGGLYQQKRNPIADWAYSFAGQIYIAMPFTLLNFIANTN